MIEPIAGGPLPTMGRNGGGGNGNQQGDAAKAAATAAPAEQAAAEAELLENLPPLLAYGVNGRLLTNGNQHARKPLPEGQEEGAEEPVPDEHVNREA